MLSKNGPGLDAVAHPKPSCSNRHRSPQTYLFNGKSL